MDAKNEGAGHRANGEPAPEDDRLRSAINNSTDRPSQSRAQVHELRHGRGRVLVRVVPDETTPLYRVEWPDIGLSPPVNLARAKEAAQLWAESKTLKDLRKNGAERALKSIENFSWSSSPVRKNEVAAIEGWTGWPPSPEAA